MELNKKDKDFIDFVRKKIINFDRNESITFEKFLDWIIMEYIEKTGIDPRENEDSTIYNEEYQYEFTKNLQNLYEWTEVPNFSEGDSIYDYVVKDTLQQFDAVTDNLIKTQYARFLKLSTEGIRIKLDKKWHNILLKTDNILEYKNLPYQYFFLDTCIILKNIKILGVLIENLDENTRDEYELREVGNNLGKDFTNKNVRIDFKVENYEKLEIRNISKLLSEVKGVTKPLKEDYLSVIESEIKFDNEISKVVFNFIFNICDMLNNQQVEKNKVNISEKRNLKREKANLTPLPHTTINLVPNNELKEYITKFNNNSSKISHKYLVRGHYRSLIDENRYKDIYEQFYNNNLNGNYILSEGSIKTWIRPHYRGSGIRIKKNVNLR